MLVVRRGALDMSALEITDEMIDACGFRMFSIPEIARTMVMADHPLGGAYRITGNKRSQMAKYGNAVTPPVSRLLLERLAEVLGGGFTYFDQFCGAGGTAIGATQAGGELVGAVNHSRSAVDDHESNFPQALHDCADVSALTTRQIRAYPVADVLITSPECTFQSNANTKIVKPRPASLFDDGPAASEEQERSRATMWDVCRFVEQALLKGHPYKAIVVENVVEAFKWGADNDGQVFQQWRLALEAFGYRSEIVWLNSMFCPPTPQSRDRMYVVYWHKTVAAPNLQVEPVAYCPSCEKVIYGRQTWKRPDSPVHKRNGMPTGGKYGQQYLYACPDCRGWAIPGAHPAIDVIDFSIPTPLIGERVRPIESSTRERARTGLYKILTEPFAIRLLQGGIPKPLTLPIVTLTARHDLAMVFPVAGNTYETTPGNRARDAGVSPMSTLHQTFDRALVVPNRANNVPKDAGRAPVAPILTGGTIALLRFRQNGDATPVEDPTGTVSARGNHHGIVMRNNSGGSEMSTPIHEPFRTLTARCHQSFIVPYRSTPHGPEESVKTLTTRDRMALVVPPSNNSPARDARLSPSFTQVTETRPMLVELPS